MTNELEPILYIDDEPENLRGFQFLFKAYYKIFTAQSAEEGFEVLRQQKVKIIIADQRMPKMTGVDFFEIISKSHPEIIRIILTGYADIEAIIRAINEGNIFKYVTKPWNRDEFKLILDNALWSYNIAEENRKLIQNLKEANQKLEQSNQNLEQKVKVRTEEILVQKHEIEIQRDIAKMQRDQIASQNEELEIHRNQLEQLVAERTADLLKAKEKAEMSDKLKSAFLANLSHEIRTPMNAIMGFSQLLAFNEIEEKDRKDYLNLILVNGQHLLNLINEIIDISRIEVGEMSLNYTECSISNIFREILIQYEEQKAIIEKNNITVRVKPGTLEQNFIISTDGSKLKQVLVNLMENALKFTENGYIEYGYYLNPDCPDDEIVVYVKDSGIGISEEAKDFIFERFRKVEDFGATKLYRGAGLGLAISKRLVEFLGGRIWVESEINKGSTFYFTLPKKGFKISEYHGGKIIESKVLNYNWKNRIILVAEDELTNYKYIEKVLSRTRISLLWAKNGIETCEIFENNKDIDLILMDIRMPLMDGYEATRRIKQSNQDIKIIAQTAYALEYEKEEILKAGCDDYIAKPYSETDLLKMLDKYFV